MVTPFDADLAVDHVGVRAAGRLAARERLRRSRRRRHDRGVADPDRRREARAVPRRRSTRSATARTGHRRHRHQRHRHSVELTRARRARGVDAVLVVTPYYNKPPERGLHRALPRGRRGHDLPVIIYNIPSRCGVNLSPEALATLAEVDNIVAVKQANPDLDELDRAARDRGPRRLRRQRRHAARRRCAAAGCGGICVASHLVGPRTGRARPAASRAGDVAGAEAIDAELRAALQGALRDHQPDPGQGGAEPARPRGRRPAPAARRGRRRGDEVERCRWA